MARERTPGEVLEFFGGQLLGGMGMLLVLLSTDRIARNDIDEPLRWLIRRVRDEHPGTRTEAGMLLLVSFSTEGLLGAVLRSESEWAREAKWLLERANVVLKEELPPPPSP